VDVVPGDLREPGVYREYLKGCAAVLHCAGATRGRSLEEYRRVNVEGTSAIAKTAAVACPEAMFVHVSSQAAAGPSRDGVPVQETDAPEPVSWYGRSKLEGEQAVARHHPGPWCIVRPSIVYGAGDPGLLQMFSVVARGVAPIPAGGRQRVQLLAAEDLAPILFAAAQRPDLHGRRGFAAGETVSMGDLVREIAALRTPPARTVRVPEGAVRFLGLVESMRGALTRSTPCLSIATRPARCSRPTGSATASPSGGTSASPRRSDGEMACAGRAAGTSTRGGWPRRGSPAYDLAGLVFPGQPRDDVE
jgi:nucleoside-diphosphate-sugar epimerase